MIDSYGLKVKRTKGNEPIKDIKILKNPLYDRFKIFKTNVDRSNFIQITDEKIQHLHMYSFPIIILKMQSHKALHMEVSILCRCNDVLLKLRVRLFTVLKTIFSFEKEE